MGSALGRLWSERGHEVTFGVRDPAKESVVRLVKECGAHAAVATISEAVKPARVVVLSIPWRAAPEVIAAAGDLTGKIVVDCTNPVAPGLDGVSVAAGTSAAEEIARLAPGAKVVKAFNTIGADSLANPTFGADRATAFLCGDDAEAKGWVATLAEQLGFEAIDAGPLTSARMLEPMAVLWIRLSGTQIGRGIAFKLLRRPP